MHVKLVLFVSLSASAVISVVFLKETLRASDILGESFCLVFSCCIEKLLNSNYITYIKQDWGKFVKPSFQPVSIELQG